MKLRRGFVKESEDIATEIWSELQAHPKTGLDPFSVADFIEIPVKYLDSLADEDAEAVGYFDGVTANSPLDALTIMRDDGGRVIYLNDSQSETRLRSSLAHEIAHGLLMHSFVPPLREDKAGRTYDSEVESEAARLGGAVLIPQGSAIYLAKAGLSDSDLGELYGLSTEMARYRMNVTASRKIAGNGGTRRVG